MSQTDLARLIGFPSQYINNVEAGRRGVSEESLKKIAAALKVPVVALLPEEAA